MAAGLVLFAPGRDRTASSLPDPYPVEAVVENFEWTFRHPGPDGRLHTADDPEPVRDLRLPDQTSVELRLTSRDYIYSFHLPDFGAREMAVPELAFSLELQTGEPGEFAFRSDPVCGRPHASGFGRLIVEPRRALRKRWSMAKGDR
ncbi:MAG: hypothetical protein AAF492_19360 [Verrucomicrobiota bacterium]